MSDWRERGKDAAPEKTVERIKALLAKAGIEVEYEEMPRDIEVCHSSRVVLKGPGGSFFGANGKGVSSALCEASAYAELMERLQNIMFAAVPLCDDPNMRLLLENDNSPLYEVEGEYQPECVRALKARLAASVPPSPFGPSPERVVDALLTDVSCEIIKGRYTTRPFYSLREKRYVNLPSDLITRFALSNGMASGNTLEEAIVQAASEIFERYAELRFLEKRMVPSPIPREAIARYPLVDGIMREIERGGRYRAFTMDCSMGIGIPVVCGVIADTRVQRFGIKFGSHPDMGVALERVFSESMQGNTLERFCGLGDVLFDAEASKGRVNSWNLIKTGAGSFPAELFMGSADAAPAPWPSVAGMSNREVMRMALDKLEEMGADVYIRDCSILGFPCVRIYASGISEVVPVDVLQLKQIKLHIEAHRAFRHLSRITDDEARKLAMLARVKRAAVLENTIASVSGLCYYGHMPGAPNECGFLLALCLYRLGDVAGAANEMSDVMRYRAYLSEDDYAYINAARKYLAALAAGYSREDAARVLDFVCPRDVLARVLDDFADPMTTLAKAYPACRELDCEHCTVKDCGYPRVFGEYLRLTRLEAQNRVDEATLRSLLEA